MLERIRTLPIHRVALTLTVITVLGFAAGSPLGVPAAPSAAQAPETTPVDCVDSVWSPCSWTD
jgi:hypothetical protein